MSAGESEIFFTSDAVRIIPASNGGLVGAPLLGQAAEFGCRIGTNDPVLIPITLDKKQVV